VLNCCCCFCCSSCSYFCSFLCFVLFLFCSFSFVVVVFVLVAATAIACCCSNAATLGQDETLWQGEISAVVCIVCMESRPKMYLYSCHDSTLTALLLALGCCDDEWPPFAADLAFELYEDANRKHWVKIRYCGKVRSLLANW